MSECSRILGIALAAIVPAQSAVAQPSGTNCTIVCRVRIPFGSSGFGSASEARAISCIQDRPMPTIWVSGEVLESKDIWCGKRLSILVRKRLSVSVTLSSPSLGEQIEVDVVKCFYSNGKVGDVVGTLIFQMPDASGVYHPVAC